MSGLYLPNATLPKYGHMIQILFDGSVNYVDMVNPYREMYPAISVQDHGRLGDLDALASEIQVSLEEGDSWMNSPIKMAQRAMRVADLQRIRSAPTIIPSDKTGD